MAARKPGVIWCEREWWWPWYGYCPSFSDLKAEFERLGIRDDPIEHWAGIKAGRCDEWTGKDGKLCIVVSIKSENTRDLSATAGIIVHEAMHVFEHLCRHIGEETPSSEFRAYSLQTIFGNLFDAFTKAHRPYWLKGHAK